MALLPVAIRSGLPLLPVGIAGTFRVHRRGTFHVRPDRVVVSVGEPLDVAGKTAKDRAAVTVALRDSIERLRDEARDAGIRSGEGGR